LKYLLILFSLALGTQSYGTEQSLPGLVTSNLYYWIEPKDQLHDVNMVLEEAQWQELDRELNFGYSNDTLWVMQNIRAYREGDWVLQIPYPLIDYLDLYVFQGDELISILKSGDARQFSSRHVKVPDFVVGISNKDPSSFRIVGRIETQGTMMLPVKWWPEIEYAEQLALEQTIYGAYYGVLIVMAIYHLFIFLVIREKEYFFYTITVSAFILLQLSFDGRGFAWLWPNTPEVNHYSFPLAYSLYQLAVLTFMSVFLRLSENSKKLYRYFFALRVIVGMNLVGLFVLDYSTATPMIVVTGVVSIVSGLFSGAYLWYRGFTAARYFTSAWALFLVGILILNLRGLGIGETNWISVYGYLFGSMLEVLFLAFSLADRISSANRERRLTEKALIKSKDEHLNVLQRFQHLYENSPIGNFQSNNGLALNSVNQACAEIFGFHHREDMLAKVTDIRRYLKSDFEEFQTMVHKARAEGQTTDNELLIKNQQGEERWISINLRYIEIGGETGFEGTVQDITERKLAEKLQEDLDKERLNIMEQFSLGIAKEISIPLGSNVATTSFLKDGFDEIQKQKVDGDIQLDQYDAFVNLTGQSLELVGKNQKRITKIVKRFREVSSWHQDLKLSHIELLELVEGVINSQRWRMAGWRVDIDCDPELQIKGYKSALNAILIQLIDNALYHSHADQGQTPMIYIRVQDESKDEVSICVTDNGIGIKKELVKNLCKPFFTTQKGPDGHIGLGLYMVYNLVCQTLKGRLFFPVQGEGFSVQMMIPKHLD